MNLKMKALTGSNFPNMSSLYSKLPPLTNTVTTVNFSNSILGYILKKLGLEFSCLVAILSMLHNKVVVLIVSMLLQLISHFE